MHSPTPAERQLLDDWIRDLRAFVHDEKGYAYGTTRPDEFKAMTPQGTIEIQNDDRWNELLGVIDIFSR
jgi:hypothetical protein